MGYAIDHFNGDFQRQFQQVTSEVEYVKNLIGKEDPTKATYEIKRRLRVVTTRILAHHEKVTAAKREVALWNEVEKVVSEETLLRWKAKRERIHLQDHADKAERYAVAMEVIAMNAMDEAEEATLTAWIARHDAEIAEHL